MRDSEDGLVPIIVETEVLQLVLGARPIGAGERQARYWQPDPRFHVESQLIAEKLLGVIDDGETDADPKPWDSRR